MKKYLVILIFLVCLGVNTYNAFNIEQCSNEIKLSSLNSKNALEYINSHNLTDKIVKICSSDICMKINSSNLERDINSFIQENISYLEDKDEEVAKEIELKGFKIDKIIINSCD